MRAPSSAVRRRMASSLTTTSPKSAKSFQAAACEAPSATSWWSAIDWNLLGRREAQPALAAREAPAAGELTRHDLALDHRPGPLQLSQRRRVPLRALALAEPFPKSPVGERPGCRAQGPGVRRVELASHSGQQFGVFCK